MATLPVHGFVLAGGKSTRMGVDKALLEFHGRPMVAIAVETLRAVCQDVAIAGNRDDLADWAPVVHESRVEAGPAAGIEAALLSMISATKDGWAYEWALLLPVDLPLMPPSLLRRWVATVGSHPEVRASYLEYAGEWHPALCLVHRDCLGTFQAALDAGDRKLVRIFSRLGERLLVLDAAEWMTGAEPCFANVNTPEELAAAEQMKY